MTKRLAVVLFNLGGPDSLSAVQPFLFNLFNDKAIIGLPQPLRSLLAKLISGLRTKTAKAIYAHMGGRSPLLDETDAQAEALTSRLRLNLPEAEILVVIAMRYWRPFTAEAAAAVEAFRPTDIVLTPLYPQYSTTTTGSSTIEWTSKYKGPGQIHAICCYPDQPDYVEAHVSKILSVVDNPADLQSLRVVFSAHGLPERIVAAGDPYQHQIERSAGAIAARLGVKDWKVSYQSRVGPMKWLAPSTIDIIREAGRDGVGLLVVPIAFVSEHSETLVELDIDYRRLAEEAGVPVYLRAPALSADPHFIEALVQMVTTALAGDGVIAGANPCRVPFKKCPRQCAVRRG